MTIEDAKGLVVGERVRVDWQNKRVFGYVLLTDDFTVSIRWDNGNEHHIPKDAMWNIRRLPTVAVAG